MVLLCQWFGAAHTHVYDLRFRQTGCRTGKDASVCGKIDYVVIAGEYFKPDNTESPSLRAMRDLLSTEYCRERSFFREVTNLDIYRRVKRD